MRIHSALPLAAATLALLSGCGGTSLFNRDRPDEMAVTRQHLWSFRPISH